MEDLIFSHKAPRGLGPRVGGAPFFFPNFRVFGAKPFSPKILLGAQGPTHNFSQGGKGASPKESV